MTPIILFAYNRPDHTRRVLESLERNPEARDSELYVFIDGSKDSKDDILRKEMISLIISKKWCKKVHIKVSPRNFGISSQIINRVTQFCKERGRVIVLEDDTLLSPFFLSYMNKALDKYAAEEKIMAISGYMFPVGNLSTETGFMRGNCSWGWGTWDRAWKNFEPDAKKLLFQLRLKKAQHEINFEGSYNVYKMSKRNPMWDVRWVASIFVNNGLILFPSKSLVNNIGFDGSGISGSGTDAYNTTLSPKPITKFPSVVEETPEFFYATVECFRSQRTAVGLAKRVYGKVKQTFWVKK